jgi:hypothetical protein
MAARRHDRANHVPEVRLALSDPYRVAELLELEKSREEKGKWRCPRHGGTSLSLRRGKDGTLQVKCFGCDLAGDVFVLLAEVRGLNVKTSFGAVLREAAELAGLWHVVSDLSEDGAKPKVERAKPLPAAPPRAPKVDEEERTYPPGDELATLWDAGIAPEDDEEASAMLAARGLDAGRVEGTGCARVIRKDAPLPRWARRQGRSWTATGHRLILPVFDVLGVMRSVRAWRVVEDDSPKRLPPGGHKAAGLVLACEIAQAMLRGTYAPPRVLILEGEPDFLTWASRPSSGGVTAMLGVVSGAWTEEIAARVPSGARVIVRTHHDKPGNKYAEEINVTLRERCKVLRPKGDA